MTEQAWIRSHVERLLQDQWQVCRVHADDDGDYMFRNGTAAGWVSVLASEPVMVRVFAHAVHGLKPSLSVLRELNDIQSRSLSTSIGLIHGWVTVSQTISPIALSQEVLAQAISAVGAVANDIGVLLAGCSEERRRSRSKPAPRRRLRNGSRRPAFTAPTRNR